MAAIKDKKEDEVSPLKEQQNMADIQKSVSQKNPNMGNSSTIIKGIGLPEGTKENTSGNKFPTSESQYDNKDNSGRTGGDNPNATNIQSSNPSTYENSGTSRVTTSDRRYNFESLADSLKDANIKVQKAAIMARNMSHNIGSHVMAYLKQQLQSVDVIKSNFVLADLQEEADADNKPTGKYAFKDGKELPFLVGLGHFISYLQERQDYIATIATDYIPYCSPIDFKEAIFDGLNPDLKYKRHKKANQNMNGRQPQNILLENIARSEGFTHANSEGEKKSINISFGYDKDNDWVTIHGHDIKEMDGMRHHVLSIPGGISGRQAIFSIVENIIRNAAKHEKIEGPLSLQIGYIDGSDIETTKGFKNEGLRNIYVGSAAIEDFVILSFSIETSRSKDDIPSVVESIKEGLNCYYLEEKEDHQLVPNNEKKGLKEIRISAAWLRGDNDLDISTVLESSPRQNDNEISIVDCERLVATSTRRKDKDVPLVSFEAFPDPDDQNKAIIRYFIAVKRDMPLAFILSGYNPIDREYIKKLCEEKKWKTFEDIDDYLLQVRKSRNTYQMLVTANEDEYNKLRPKSTSRIVICDKEKIDPHKDNLLAYTKAKCFGLPFYGDGEQMDKIFIEDTNAADSHNKEEMWVCENSDDRNRLQDLIKLSNGEGVKYLYRSHHDNDRNLQAYANNNIYKDVEFVESITGSNSTDRMIRREPFSFDWYYTHLHAMKSRVLILDERLYEVIHAKKSAKEIILECLDGDDPVNDAVSHLKETYPSIAQEVDNLFTRDELEEYCEKLPDENISKAVPYIQKGIDVYNIVRSGDSFKIEGYEYDETNLSISYKIIAKIKYENNSISISIDKQDENQNKFDYISIHQGLLDKIYEGFGIKEPKKKIEVTKELYKTFSCYMEKDIIGDYLPKMFIHSGRSKPTETDMPQPQPFILFAAIDYAVHDSKYSLIQLLDYAQYEQ